MQLHRPGTSHPRSDTPAQTSESLRVAPSETPGPGVSTLNRWRCPICRSLDVFAWLGAAPDSAECGNCGHIFSIGST
jgi:hypothetical protein